MKTKWTRMDDTDLYNAMGSRLGINNQEVSRQIQEYETNYLTPEMDGENFESLLSLIYDHLYLIYDNQAIRDRLRGIPIAYLSSYYGRTYGKLTRPFSSKAIIENIVPFFVVNK
jgi:hypothetical protein